MNLSFHGTLFPRKSGFSRKFDLNPFVSFGDDFVESALCCLLLPVTWFLSPSELFALFLWKGGFFSLSEHTFLLTCLVNTSSNTSSNTFGRVSYLRSRWLSFIHLNGRSFVIRFDRLVVCLFSRFSSQVSSCLVLNNFLLRFLLDFKSSVRRPMKSTQLRWVVRWMSFGRLFQTESTWEYFIVWSSICYRVTFENSNFQHFIDNLVAWQKQTRTHRFINGFFQPTTTCSDKHSMFSNFRSQQFVSSSCCFSVVLFRLVSFSLYLQ